VGVTKKLSNHPHPAKESSLTAWSIGIVKGKHHHIHNDPYTRGERLGKHVKPDAPSTANVAPPHRHSRDHTSGSHDPCASTCDCSSPYLCSQDCASRRCNPCASRHVCTSPHLCSQDHATLSVSSVIRFLFKFVSRVSVVDATSIKSGIHSVWCCARGWYSLCSLYQWRCAFIAWVRPVRRTYLGARGAKTVP